MGWLFSHKTRDDLIRDLTATVETERCTSKTVSHRLCHEHYDVLWSVVEITVRQEGVIEGVKPGQPMRIIRCDLLERSDGQWGYKPMEESAHPYYYSCPLEFLDMAPEQCGQWREKVRAYHAGRLNRETTLVAGHA